MNASPGAVENARAASLQKVAGMSDKTTTEVGSRPALAERSIRVINKMGVHARPATKIVETASSFCSLVSFLKDGEEIDAKSIFGVMTMAAVQGTELDIRASGEDALAAVEAIEKLFIEGFGELEEDALREARKEGRASE